MVQFSSENWNMCPFDKTVPNLATQKLGKQNQNLMAQWIKAHKRVGIWCHLVQKTELAKLMEAFSSPARCEENIGSSQFWYYTAEIPCIL